MSKASSRPLISFSILGFNQERFIRSAIEGAFAQSYSPLEIVLSDDCSSDQTFAIMQRMASAYRGPHTVVVRRSTANLGIMEHANQVVRACRGELVVGAAGDDVSLPHRAQRVYEAWEDSSRRAGSIWSEYLVIDQDGTEIGTSKVAQTLGAQNGFAHLRLAPADFVAFRCPVVSGCTHAFRRDLFTTFGDLPRIPNLVIEDTTINFRSVLAGHAIAFIPEQTVRYRQHANTISNSHQGQASLGGLPFDAAEARRRTTFRRLMAVCDCFAHDIETAFQKALISDPTRRLLIRETAKTREGFFLGEKLIGSETAAALGIILRLLCLGRGRRRLLASLPRVLPYTWYRALVSRSHAPAGRSRGTGGI